MFSLLIILQVSQSAQWAPFNVGALLCALVIYKSLIVEQAEYKWLNTTDNLKIYDPTVTVLNTYIGGK